MVIKSKKSVLITGGSGFIGRNLKEYLQKKYNVFAPSHKELDLLDADRVRKYILRNKVDVIIHSAIIGGGKEDVGLTNILSGNIRMFLNLARNSHLVEKIFWFSSGLEYDKSRSLKMIREADFDKRIPQDDYGLYKYACAKFSENSKNIYDLILFGIYGKHEDYLYKFISNSIIKNLLKLPIVIMQNVYFDYLFLEDLPPILDYFITHKPKYHRYNLSTGQKIDLVTLAQVINGVADFKSEIKVIKKGLNKEYTASNNRLKKEIRSLKFTSHAQAIRELYNWYKNNLDKINVDKIKEDPHLKFLKKSKTLYK